MERMFDRLARYSRMKLLLIFFLTIEITIRSIDYILFFIDPVIHANSIGEQSYVIDAFFSRPLIYSFILVNLIGPIIETLIFQVLFLLAIKKLTEWILKSDSWLPALVLTTLGFAAVHGLEYTNFYYWFINASIRLPLSFFLALMAVIEFRKENGHPILCVFVLHALYNTTETILLLASTA